MATPNGVITAKNRMLKTTNVMIMDMSVSSLIQAFSTGASDRGATNPTIRKPAANTRRYGARGLPRHSERPPRMPNAAAMSMPNRRSSRPRLPAGVFAARAVFEVVAPKFVAADQPSSRTGRSGGVLAVLDSIEFIYFSPVLVALEWHLLVFV